MTFSDSLDLGKFLAGAAEPNMNVGILDPDLLGEIGYLHASFSGCFQGGEDLLLKRAAGGALCGTSGFGSLGDLSFFRGTAAALSARADGLAGDEGGELALDLLDFGKEAFLAFSKFDEVAQSAAIDVC